MMTSAALRAQLTDLQQQFFQDFTSPLFKAILHGDVEGIQTSLQGGADIKAVCGDREFSPLHAAAQSDSTEIANMLLQAGAEIDALDRDGNTALHEAIKKRNFKVAQALIKAGADVNTVNNLGCSPLFDAVVEGDLEVIQALIIERSEVNIVNYQGMTPLLEACTSLKSGIVETLIAAGAEVNPTNQWKSAPILSAAGNSKKLQALIEAGADPNVADDKGVTALHRAAAAGQLGSVEILIGAGAKVNAFSKYQFQRTKLDEEGEVMFVCKDYDSSPFDLARSKSHIGVMAALLQAGANAGFKDEEVERIETPLTKAVYLRAPGVITTLLEKNPNLCQTPNARGMTALAIAAKEGYFEEAEALIQRGACIDSNVLFLAVEGKYEKLAHLLASKSHGLYTSLEKAEEEQFDEGALQFLQDLCSKQLLQSLQNLNRQGNLKLLDPAAEGENGALARFLYRNVNIPSLVKQAEEKQLNLRIPRFLENLVGKTTKAAET